MTDPILQILAASIQEKFSDFNYEHKRHCLIISFPLAFQIVVIIRDADTIKIYGGDLGRSLFDLNCPNSIDDILQTTYTILSSTKFSDLSDADLRTNHSLG